MPHTQSIISSRHPRYTADTLDFEKWRDTYHGGQSYIQKYLIKYSRQEGSAEFENRKKITPIPNFAKAALNDVRNAIFQRMEDITRTGGSPSYKRGIQGLDLGVDLRGSTMNKFMGDEVLTELLMMGRVGIYVDMPTIRHEFDRPLSLAETRGTKPYLYMYRVEDILSWTCSFSEEPSEFQALLLRDTCLNYDQVTNLPLDAFERFRLFWINQETGKVMLQFFDQNGDPYEGSVPIELDLERIPFVMLDIGDSLLRDVCQHQLALLNLVSSDVSYALKSNYPFYTEQRDLRAVGEHLKKAANPEGTAEAGGQGAHLKQIQVGATDGRAYDLGADRPGFIHPSSEPLKASMTLQEKLETDIRKIISLAVTSLGATQQSAASKQIDNQGLESGLSYIGLVMESAERKVGEFWAAYENARPGNRLVPVVKYPERYNLKTTADRIDESSKLSELISKTPSKTARKELWKMILNLMLGSKIKMEQIDAINKEIDDAKFTTSDPEVILKAVEAGLADEETGSLALGFAKGIVEQARLDHAERIKRIQQAQAPPDAAARGLPDLAPDASAAKQEKEESQNVDTEESRKKPVRGEADG